MNNQRPTSPHLQVYRPQLTSILSISHRIAGMILLGGFVVMSLLAILVLLAPGAYIALQHSIPSVLVYLLIFMVSAAWIYHFLNGMRHLAWDKLMGLDLNVAYKTGYTVIALFLIILVGVWIL